MIETNRIHDGIQLYKEFCQYAGITFVKDPGCDQYTGTTGITFYDNPVVKGCIRWEYNQFYGNIVTVRTAYIPEGQTTLHEQILSGEFDIPNEYKYKGLITRHSFERWLNDELLKISTK